MNNKNDKSNQSRTVQYQCPHCKTVLETDEAIEGMQVNCPECAGVFMATPRRTVPQPVARESPAIVLDGNVNLSITVPLLCQGIMLLFHGMYFASSLYDISIRSFAAMLPGWAFSEVTVSLWRMHVFFGVLAILSGAILHFKCWKAIPREFARMSPGNAVGLLFVPVFHLYWVFPSVGGLGAKCAMLAAVTHRNGFGYLKGLGITLAIIIFCLVFTCFTPLGFIFGLTEFFVWVAFYRGVTRLLNNLAETGKSISFRGSRG